MGDNSRSGIWDTNSKASVSAIFLPASSRTGPPKTWTPVAQRKFDGRLSPRSYPHGSASTKAVLGLVQTQQFRRRGRLRSTIIKGLRSTAEGGGATRSLATLKLL